MRTVNPCTARTVFTVSEYMERDPEWVRVWRTSERNQCPNIWIKVPRECECGDYGTGSVHQAESAGRGLVE